MFSVPAVAVLCGVCVYLSGCGTASTTTFAPITTTSTTTRPGAQAWASLGSNPDACSGSPHSLLELQSGTLAVKYTVAYENDYISLFVHGTWEDALENNQTDVAYSATLALPGTSVGSTTSHAMQELQGGILAAGAYTEPDIANNYGIFLFDSTLINNALTNSRTNVSSRANLAVIEDGVQVHALQELQDGHLAVAVSSRTQGKILLFHRVQIEDAIAMNQTGVEARASLAGWEADEDMNLHALQQLQGGHLAVSIKGGIQLFDHALIEDVLANNRTNVPANAALAGPTSDTDMSALEELQGGHLAAGTGFLGDSSSGILLFERKILEDALSNNRTGVKARANLACGSSKGVCSFWSLQELHGGHLAAGDFSRGVVLFSNASIVNALANNQTDVRATGMLAGDSVVALQELSWMERGGNLAVAMRGYAVPVFSHAIINDVLAENQHDVKVV